MRCLNTLIYVAKNKIVSSQALHLPQLFLETIKLLGKKKETQIQFFLLFCALCNPFVWVQLTSPSPEMMSPIQHFAAVVAFLGWRGKPNGYKQ